MVPFRDMGHEEPHMMFGHCYKNETEKGETWKTSVQIFLSSFGWHWRQ